VDKSKEKIFYDSLGVVPQIPNGILENIERAAVHTSVIKCGLIAACLCLALIIPAFVLTKIAPSAAYADNYESMSELLYAFEYLNGDIDDSTYNYLIDDE
jgi:hypothetical protein